MIHAMLSFKKAIQVWLSMGGSGPAFMKPSLQRGEKGTGQVPDDIEACATFVSKRSLLFSNRFSALGCCGVADAVGRAGYRAIDVPWWFFEHASH